MTYIINWAQTGNPPNGKPAIALPPLTVDSTSTSLTLTGKGTPNYGEIQQENFIRLLENFSSSTPPANPTSGQCWFNTVDNSLYVYDMDGVWKRIAGVFKSATAPSPVYEGDMWWDTVNNRLFVYDGTQWGQIWPSLSVIPVAFVDEYNSLVDRYNKIAATPSQHTESTSNVEADTVAYDGTIVHTSTPLDSVIAGKTYGAWYGYNQNPIAHATVANMTNSLWVDLLTKFEKVALHQGTALTGFTTEGFILNKDTSFGIAKALTNYKAIFPVIDQIELNRFNVNPLSLENSVLQNSSYTRTASYFYAKTHEVAFNFNNINHARGFFNSGGKFVVNLGFTPSQSTVFSNSWKNFVASIGPVTFDVKGTSYGSTNVATGFYDLTLGGIYKTLVTLTSSLPGSYGSYITIKARLESVPNSSAVIVRIQITFAPEGVNNVYHNAYNQGTYSSSNSAAIGTTTSSITTFKASEINLSDAEIPYPTASQTGTLITDNAV